MKAARLTKFGAPQDSIHVVEEEVGPLAPGEALLEVLVTPINPSDIATIAGLYGVLPKLPGVPGNEGVGRVVQVEGEAPVQVGDLVFLPMGSGTWRTHMKAKAQRLLPVPPGKDLLQMSMLSVNPPTAELLLSEFGKPQRGEWVIQNTANSAVGRYLISLAKLEGIKTINVVRRKELEPELKALGADVVLEDGDGLAERVREATGGAKVMLGIDAVGGSATLRLGDAVSAGGTVVHYGSMSGKAATLSPAALIFRNVTLRGFWLVPWFNNTPRETQAALMARLAKLVGDGTLNVPVDATFPLENLQEALARAMEGGRQGKVLLTPVKR
ncbi:zinc-dependent alcohol dehydrogenase family protein [Hyalangium minutum]|uniref:enoyl-[acyl-carrier-protein] reductase n=1 Tax=Hyalangium minutum TaxID=394096 RepID=A0A085WGM2_9BACT|nr:zinc-dependent alcohol dehydrogenase family protein [Hyalangium minutum]KFE66835.1 putative oxidoreductase [Hyalangium minutum]